MERLSNKGRILALSISKQRGTPKINVPSAEFIAEWGVKDDAHAGPSHRQVSLLAVESIAKIHARGLEVQPGAFAENITTTGIDLSHLRIGDRLAIGDVLLEVTQIGKECQNRCAIFEQVGDCVMPREGIFARVIRGGVVCCDDLLTIRPIIPELAEESNNSTVFKIACRTDVFPRLIGRRLRW